MSKEFRWAAVLAVLALSQMAIGAATAQIVVGGGATLPEFLYDEILPSGVGLGDYSYSGTGSGIGKSAFLSNIAPREGTAKARYYNESLGSDNDAYLWPATQSVHFAGSESALTVAERDAYNVAHLSTWGRLIQIPVVATAVLVPYKRTSINNLDLSDAQMCAVFGNKPGGQTWGQLRGTADTTPVNVVYRTEESGVTELLSRYLVTACPSTGFVVSGSFAKMVAGAVGSELPVNWTPVRGSAGMSSAFASAGVANGRIGYQSPDPAYTDSSNAAVAKINGTMPVAASMRAVLATVSLPVGGVSQAGNPLAWLPAYVKPVPAIYPIFGTSNLLVSQCYRDARVQAKVKAFLAGLLGTAYDLPIASHNLVVLPDGRGGMNNWKAQIANVFLNASHPLGIGNANVCNGIGRPMGN